MACTAKRCGLILTEFVLDLQILRRPGILNGVFAIEGPLALLGRRPITLPDILEMADRALKDAVAVDAPQQDPNQTNRVFGIVPDPEFLPCEDGCECAGVEYKALKTETVVVDAIFSVRENTYSATTTATRTVSEGVGRCRTANYFATRAFAGIPELNLEVVLARAEPVTEDELARLREIFSPSVGT